MLLSWLPLARTTVRADVIAGLTLWGLIVPEAIAYAGLATAPAAAGLYTTILAVGIYALLGSSRHLVASATSATAATSAVVVGSLSVDPGPAIAAVAIATGAAFLIAGVLRLDFIIQFISKPVNEGFIFGLAVFVSVGQLSKFLGVEKPEGNAIMIMARLPGKLGQTNLASLAIGLAALAGLFLLPRINKKIPAGLVVLGATIALSTVFDLSGSYDVDTVGKLPSGLPLPAFPSLQLSDWAIVATASVGIVLVGMSEALSVAKQVADQHGYDIDNNRELLALGVASLGSGLFGGMVGAGSMSATSLNVSAGARTPVSALTAALAAAATALFLSPVFTNLPEAVLAALIIHAVAHHMAPAIIRRFAAYSTTEYWLALVALVGVLLFDALYGLLFAMFINLLYFIARSTQMSVVPVGTTSDLPSTLVRQSDINDIEVPDNVLAIQPNNRLYYGNSPSFATAVREALTNATDAKGTVVIDLDNQHVMDLTSAETIVATCEWLQRHDQTVYLTNVASPVATWLETAGLNTERTEHEGAKVHVSRSFAQLQNELW